MKKDEVENINSMKSIEVCVVTFLIGGDSEFPRCVVVGTNKSCASIDLDWRLLLCHGTVRLYT